jgi:UDP-glucuronate 4-epimerase
MTEKHVALVTGVAGFIGSHLAERLLGLDYSVIGLDNFDDCYSPDIKWNNIHILEKDTKRFKLVQGDIRDENLLKQIFTGSSITTVLHLAGQAGVRPSLLHPLLYQDVNVRGTINLLEVSKAFRVNQFIFSSSSSVYGINDNGPFNEEQKVNYPISPYAASKAAAELFCRTYSHLYSVPTIILRLFTVYGPRQRPEMAIHHFARMIDQGKEVTLFGDGTSTRDYTYIDDIIDGFEGALGYRGETFQIFNLGNGRAVSLINLVQLIEKGLGKKAKITHITPPQGEVPVTLADISKAQKKLGYNPKTRIEEGVSLFVRWYTGDKELKA